MSAVRCCPAADLASITAVDAAGANSSSSPDFIHIGLISNGFLQLVGLKISIMDILAGVFLCRLGLALEIEKGAVDWKKRREATPIKCDSLQINWGETS
jgi:hypothetical protein